MLQSARPIHGRNVAHRQSHRRTKARSGRRTHHSSFARLACAYLWNVAENRFFRSLPLAPFFTNFAALLALFTFSSARDAASCAIRQSKALPVVSRAAPRVVRDAARRSLFRARDARSFVASHPRRARTFRRRHRSCARGKDGAGRDARRGVAGPAKPYNYENPSRSAH